MNRVTGNLKLFYSKHLFDDLLETKHIEIDMSPVTLELESMFNRILIIFFSNSACHGWKFNGFECDEIIDKTKHFPGRILISYFDTRLKFQKTFTLTCFIVKNKKKVFIKIPYQLAIKNIV